MRDLGWKNGVNRIEVAPLSFSGEDVRNEFGASLAERLAVRFNDLVGSDNANKAKQMAGSIVRMGKVTHRKRGLLVPPPATLLAIATKKNAALKTNSEGM